MTSQLSGQSGFLRGVAPQALPRRYLEAATAPTLTGREPRPMPLPVVRRRHLFGAWLRRGTWCLPAALVVLTAVVRAVDLASAYDINGDEVDYTSLSMSLGNGAFPPRFDHQTFLLHPPLFFSFGGVWDHLAGTQGPYLDHIYAIREMNVAFAVVSAALVYALGSRLAGRWAGAGAAVLFALDPYILRQNGRAMLETSTLAFVLAGYLLIVRLADGEARRTRAAAAGGGLLLGLSMVDKDVAAVLVVVPLLVMLIRPIGLTRRVTAVALGASVAPYAVYLVVLAGTGYFGSWLSQETLGLRRQLGLVQGTGFNTKGNPSLLTTALDQLGSFGVTYIISALGVAAALLILLRAPRQTRPSLRIWSLVTLAGAASLAYSVAFGTIEEQMLYFMYVPALVTLVAGLVVLARSRPRMWWARAVTAAVAAFAVYDATVWGQVRAAPDNGEARLISWFHHHAPHPGPIADNTAVTTMLLNRSGFQAFNVNGPRMAAAAGSRYVTILSATLVGNYGSLDKAQARQFERHGKLVFQYKEGTYGAVSVYETTDASLW